MRTYEPSDFTRMAEERGLLDDVMEQSTPVSDKEILDAAIERINNQRTDRQRWVLALDGDDSRPVVRLLDNPPT